MSIPACDDPASWTWPADVRARLDAQRIAIPEAERAAPAAPKPAPPPPATGADEDDDDVAWAYAYGGCGL